MTRYRYGQRTRGDGTEMLTVTCWCERSIIEVPASEVAAGRTGPCRRGCKPDAPESPLDGPRNPATARNGR
jgi:hypothetical protein